MRPIALIQTLMLAFGAPAFAEDWQMLDIDEITQALTARVLAYDDGATQNFFDDGRTLYEVTNGESWGKWWVADGAYCSTWPPSDTPSCYRVDARGLEVRFISTSGDETIGRYVDLN